MATIAIYNSKGGVGKTTLAVNLAWEATQTGCRTLLWEVDAQGDSSWLLIAQQKPSQLNAAALMHGTTKVQQQIQPTKFRGLDILSADIDSRRVENFFVAFSKQNRLARLFAELKVEYDLIVFDCPPSFSETIRKILVAVDLVIVPVIPTPLAFLGLTRVRDFMTRKRGSHPPILPVFSLVDLRRKIHKQAVAAHADWPLIRMSAKIEEMTSKMLPIGAFAPNCSNRQSMSTLWIGIEKKLKGMKVLRIV